MSVFHYVQFWGMLGFFLLLENPFLNTLKNQKQHMGKHCNEPRQNASGELQFMIFQIIHLTMIRVNLCMVNFYTGHLGM